MTVEEMLDMKVPAPFVEGQRKRLGDCTIYDVENAIMVIEVTTKSEEDIEFLRKVADDLRDIKSYRWTIEQNARFHELRILSNFRAQQLDCELPKRKATKKSKPKSKTKAKS